MNLIEDFINWVRKKPCATNGCTQRVSRWVGADEDEVVMIGDEQSGVFCPICRQQQLHEMPLPTGRTWIGRDLDF